MAFVFDMQAYIFNSDLYKSEYDTNHAQRNQLSMHCDGKYPYQVIENINEVSIIIHITLMWNKCKTLTYIDIFSR